jgi:hypothetical protein
MPFTTNNLAQIRDLLNLSPRSLLPGSQLKLKAQSLENYDTEFNTTFVVDIQSWLIRITELDGKIKLNVDNNKNSIKSEDIKDDYKVEYQSNTTDISLDLRREKSALIAKIAREFETSYNPYMTTRSRYRS